MRLALLTMVAWFAVGPSGASAQQTWVDSVFPKRLHDFGTVARGSKISHAFRIVNTTDQDIRIADWRTKCGCTDVRVGSREIPPGTQTVIEAVIDTTKFQGYKASGLTLVLDKPQFLEVDLNLTCFIRGDLVVIPGQADFGIVPRGTKPSVAINLTYGGAQPDWSVLKMQTLSEHVTARMQEVGRSPGGQVQYVLSATLNPSAPTGFFKDEITLVTNDPTGPTIPISVSANVQSVVTAAPSILNIGRVRPGQVVKKTVLVRSSQPFQVTGISTSSDDLSAAAASKGDSAKAVQTVSLTFKAPESIGPYNGVLEIATDLKDEPPVKVTTFATVAR